MSEITETEMESRDGKRAVMLQAEVGGENLWRIWREGSVSTLEKKRILLQRDIELCQKNPSYS